MDIKEILPEEFDDFDWLPDDLAEYIGRPDTHGIALMGEWTGRPMAALIWRIIINIADESKASEILYFNAPDTISADMLFKEYDRRIKEDCITQSCFAFSSCSENRKHMLEEAGFDIMEGNGHDLTVTIRDFTKIDMIKTPLSSNVSVINKYPADAIDVAIDNCLRKQTRDTALDAYYLPLSWYDPDISSCIQQGLNITGLLLIHRSRSGSLKPVLYRIWGDGDVKDMFEMLKCSVKAAYEKYPLKTKVVLSSDNEAMNAFIDRLFPGRERKSLLQGKRKENITKKGE